MPWSPSFTDAVPDPRLDAYRGRAARLTDADVVVGHVLVESDFRADVTAGMFWWSKWGPSSEFAIIFARLGESEAEVTAVDADDLGLFDQWATNGYADGDRRLKVSWLDADESARVHAEVFGHQH
jgi:hypothetical protein